MDLLRGYSHWLLRIPLAAVFGYHGTSKFVDGIDGFAQMMDLPYIVALGTATAEVSAAVLIVLGGFSLDVLTRLAGALATAVMIGAIAKVHWPRWPFTPAEGFPIGGMEFQFSMAMLGLYFLVRGNGSAPEPSFVPDSAERAT